MPKLILSGPSLFTNDPSGAYYDHGAVLIENGTILKVGDANQIKSYNPEAPVENIGNGLLTPGLINLHHHLYSSFARGWNPKGPSPANFKEILERIWWRLDERLNLDDIYYSALVGLSASALSGVTSVVDHHSSQNAISGSLRKIADAFGLIGLRGSICFELSNRGGDQAFESGLRESIDALGRWPYGGSSKMLSAMVGLHASLTLSDDNLKAIAQASASFSPGFHFHLAEDQIDQDVSLEKYGCRATPRYDKYGLLNDRSLAVHGVHLNEDEIELLKSSQTNLAICSRSNQNNAVGFAPWWNYHEVTIGLGTDGIGSDMLQEAKSALYLSRHDRKDPDFGFAQIGEMIFEKNPAIFEKITGMKVGRIASGYPADIVLWRYSPPTPIGPDNILGHYLYGLCDLKADAVWVNGNNILKDGRFNNFDYDNMLTEARKLAQSLWERF
jgi:putative selenium metabolism protein SsnA